MASYEDSDVQEDIYIEESQQELEAILMKSQQHQPCSTFRNCQQQRQLSELFSQHQTLQHNSSQQAHEDENDGVGGLNNNICSRNEVTVQDRNCLLVRDITKLSGYPRSNVKTRLEQSNYYLASGRFPLQNAIYDNKLPFSRM